MPRARNIKYSFFTNDELAELSISTRLAFIGLWTLADRNGVLENRPKKIKAQLFPYDNINISEVLENLSKAGFITKYVVNSVNYVLINNFTKHQHPHKNEKPSNFPSISEVVEIQEKSDHSSNAPNKSEKIGTAPPDCLLLITDCLLPIIDSCESDFKEFWNLYGIKKGRANCEKKYRRHIKDGITHKIIMDGLRSYQSECVKKETPKEFIKHPLTWLHGKHWEDEYEKNLTRSEREAEMQKIMNHNQQEVHRCNLISS